VTARLPVTAPLAVLLLAAALIAGCVPRVQPVGSAEHPPALTEDSFVTRDGAALPLRVWMPDKPPAAVFVALHGFNDYSNAFEAPATYWRDHGIATYAYDQRGFGETPHRGLWAGSEVMAHDAEDLVALVHARYPDVPVYLVGVSMGGAVAIRAVTDKTPPDIAGLVLVAPAVWGRSTMPLTYRIALWIGAHTVPWMTVTGRGLHITPSDNVEMLRALAADPLVIKETRIDTIHGLVDLMDEALADSDRIDLPVLILYGEKDEVVPKEPTREMLAEMPKDHRHLAVYPNGYHMLLRDLEAKTVDADVVAWVHDPGAPLPSGADGNIDGLVAKAEGSAAQDGRGDVSAAD
jgi:acylglycerol lipase